MVRHTQEFWSHVYHCKDHVLLARALDLHRPTPKASGATIRPLTTRNDFDRLRTAFPDRAADLARLRDQGLDSFGAFIDHELVGYMWVAKHDHFDVKLNEIVPLGPNEILQLAGFVAERSRGTSLALEIPLQVKLIRGALPSALPTSKRFTARKRQGRLSGTGRSLSGPLMPSGRMTSWWSLNGTGRPVPCGMVSRS